MVEDKPKGLLFYRCLGCQRVVSKWDIEKGGCKCGYNKIAPTNLNIVEKAVSIIKHPAVWKW
jgi:hypothetical protein